MMITDANGVPARVRRLHALVTLFDADGNIVRPSKRIQHLTAVHVPVTARSKAQTAAAVATATRSVCAYRKIDPTTIARHTVTFVTV